MKSGQQIAKENVESLRIWLESHKENLPRFADGTLNKSAIARSAGLDRQIFTTNPAAKELLSQYGAPSSRPRTPSEASTEVRELIRKKDAEIARLRDLIAKRELELDRLRKEANAAKQLKAMHELMVDTMRHVKAPPQ
jgi:uncharacterized phage protein gp47/JayE